MEEVLLTYRSDFLNRLWKVYLFVRKIEMLLSRKILNLGFLTDTRKSKEKAIDEPHQLEPKILVYLFLKLFPAVFRSMSPSGADALFAVAFAPALICQMRPDF